MHKSNEYIEDIIEDLIVDNLKYIYQKEDINQIMLIFFLRCMIYFNKTKLSNSNYIDFLFIELNLPNQKNIKINNIEVSKTRDKLNNFQNIFDNLAFKYLDSFYIDLINGKITIKKFSELKFTQYLNTSKSSLNSSKRRLTYYNDILQYIMLNELKNDFKLKLNHHIRINSIEYPINHNDFELTFDEKCLFYYNEYVKNNKNILEVELEDYIVQNGIDDIKIIGRQIKIKDGIIDLLGERKNKKILIELKVVNKPKDLIWQIETYKNNLEDIYNERIETVVIAPKLHESVVNLLPEHCEIYQFKKIDKNFEFKKIK